MVKIRLTASITGPAGMYPAGSELETTEKEAKSLVSNGYAEYIKDEPVITTDASDAPVAKTAAKRIRRKRKK